MSADENCFRLRVPQCPHAEWVGLFTLSPRGVVVGLTKHRANAKIVMAPTKETISRLRSAFSSLELVPATFAEWVEQEGEPADAGKAE